MLEEIKAVIEHFRTEGKVIREAPGAFVLSVLFVSAIILGLIEWHYSGLIDDQKTHISLLEAETKGLTAQPIDINRSKKLAKLQEFYSSGTHLFNIAWGDELKDGPQKVEWNKKVISWCHDTDDWIKANMGVAAQRRFESVLTYSGDRDTNINRDGVGAGYLMTYLSNLSALIENPSWDRASAP